MASDASYMLEAALEQMDDIIAGTKVAAEYTNGMYDIRSPVSQPGFGSLPVLELMEQLRIALMLVSDAVERERLRNQVPEATANYLKDWLINQTAINNETYQDRLARLEGDKESLVLQVSVLTDQVEAQGEKIRDLETSLEEHHLKLNATEEMLQQELLSRTSLETQKLDLMTDVSNLKLKLVGMEKEQAECEEKHQKAESVVNLITELQEQMCKLQLEIGRKYQERNTQSSQGQVITKSPPHGSNSDITGCSQEQQCCCGSDNGLLVELRTLKSKVDELQNEKSQYEWKLKATKLSISYSLHVCYQTLTARLTRLKGTVEHMQVEKQQWEDKCRSKQTEIAQLQEQLALKDAEIARLQRQISMRNSADLQSSETGELYRKSLRKKYQEVQRLKTGMDSLIAANEEKDRRIDELTLLLNQYLRIKDKIITAHGVPGGIVLGSSEDEFGSNLRKQSPIGDIQVEQARLERLSRGSSSSVFSHPSLSRGSSPTVVLHPSSPCRLEFSNNVQVPSEVSSHSHESNGIKQKFHRMLSNSLEELQSGTVDKSATSNHVEQKAVVTVVDQESATSNHVEQKVVVTVVDQEPATSNHVEQKAVVTVVDQESATSNHVEQKSVVTVVDQENKIYLEDNKYQTLPGKFHQPKKNPDDDKMKVPNSQSVQEVTQETEDSSSSNLRETDKSADSTLSSSDVSPRSSGTESGLQSPASPECKKNPKGIKKFFGKIKRTPSGTLQADEASTYEFRRGGLRATAGPCLSRPKDTYHPNRNSNVPFAQWTTDQVCGWLEHLGLGQYVNLARHWVKSGHTLITATPQDLEKELGFKHPLHRKKLQLCLKAAATKQEDKPGELSHSWVTRWLDDIGLPQYKDQFNEARVDGRMLQHLTVNDLLFLKVTSQLHHLSIKCAIHVLHVNKFNSNCLRRRPSDENNICPSEVVQWSNHRVMEWLRSVDLAEYAPNLRGSGVHGGLIILEPRFNADTLAMLLNIPPQKTLLRRHLTTNFNVLIGSEAQQEKREIMRSSSYTPLTTTAKVKPKKLGFSHFGTLRKKKGDDSTDYICPMDTNQSASNGNQKEYRLYKRISPISDVELDNAEQMGKNS
ncbi:liprin-beta-2 [Protopterus annectens]|uniref:liprin-beta-2 n=1 Tax=Protopterus annectens TaxID=7888 RepID=UPI001CFB2F3E|nr:liprin-beta-2 [Protopterus annectens]